MTASKNLTPSVIVLIRTRLREDADVTAYQAIAMRMDEILQTMPGCVEAKSYAAEDGEAISMIRFESLDALRTWREHPEHQVAQREGRERFYAAYDVRICSVERAYEFAVATGRN